MLQGHINSFQRIVNGTHTIFSESMQLFGNLGYGKCSLFTSPLYLLTQTLHLKSANFCLTTINFTVFDCKVSFQSTQTFEIEAIQNGIRTLIWINRGPLQKATNQSTWEPFLGLYCVLLSRIFSPKGADSYGYCEYPIEAVFSVDLATLNWIGWYQRMFKLEPCNCLNSA